MKNSISYIAIGLFGLYVNYLYTKPNELHPTDEIHRIRMECTELFAHHIRFIKQFHDHISTVVIH